MAFKTTTQAAPATNNNAKAPGGKYSAIRPPAASTPMLRDGDYVLELVSGRSARTGSTAIIKCIVLRSEGANATPVSGREERQLMINFGGKAFDSGIARILSLTMAICNCDSVEQLAAEEPNYDQMIDMICGLRTHSEIYGDDPLNGRVVFARGWNSAALSKRGDPFVNWEFAVSADQQG